mmetsp:Transcript_36998/g.38364  ORF Transcript_36998/g.38364 Transcript_36998/m.38364 type:complete len:139 (-) Transcript_36998:139-555(-)
MFNLEKKLKESTNVKKIKTTPCKFFLNNCCTRGQNCEYLHEKINNESRIPECTYSVNGVCHKKDCKLRHVTRDIPECPYYKNGYCREGNDCKFQHIKKEICVNYLIGFCPEGPNCQYFHWKSLINKDQDNIEHLVNNK